MTSPSDTAQTAEGQPLAGFVRVEVLKKRSDFVAASKARYQTAAGLTVQMRFRDDGDATVRVGFTCSKKVGNAVVRNRAKRRLREVARLDLPQLGRAGFDYVLIGKRDVTANRPFEDLRNDLAKAITKMESIGR